MDICCFFAINKDDDAKIVYKNIFDSNFYKEHKNCKFIFACSKADKKNLSCVNKLKKNNKNIKLVEIEDKDFNYKSAFNCVINDVDSEILLLGDSKIARNDLIFSKCLEKYKKGANVVHVKKKKNGIKGLFSSLVENIYNFFVNIFTGKRDRCNILTLGLYDKNIIDLLKELPQKACFLKNTKNIYGYNFRTIYIDNKTICQKNNFVKRKSKNLIVFSNVTFACFLAIFVILNALVNVSIVFNLIFIVLLTILFVLVIFSIPKYFFEKRNMI